jgi:PAS domain S-box-containing protein
MIPTHTIRKEEIPVNGAANGHAKTPAAASSDALLRELQALRRSEAVLRDFVETSTIGLHWVGADGAILWANQSELDLLGCTREEFIGRNIAEFHADEAVINDILARLSRGENLRDYPARLRHRDGSIRHVLINSSALFEDGKFVHTRCFTRDITALKQEQEARQAQLAAELADMKLLQDISAQLIEPGDEDALCLKLVDAIAAIMRSDFATMQMLYPDRGPKGELRLLASRGLTPEGAKTWEWVGVDTGSSCGQALRTGKRAIAPNVETCDFLAGTDGLIALLDAGIRASQSTPLFSRSGRMLGMISSHWRQPHTPAERDLRLLDILARQAADLIERRQAEQVLRDSEARMAAELADTKLLQDISAQLIEQGDEEALYSKLVDAAASITHSDFATMQILYPERGPKGELRLLASRGLTPEGEKVWEWVGFETESTCGQALRTGKRAIAPNVETCDYLAGTAGMAALLDAGIRAGQSTPLFSRSGRLLGMISSHWRQPHTPSERDLRLLDILARQAADLVERKQSEQALCESERRLHEIIQAIPAAVYTTDADGRITFFNKAAVEFSGRVPERGTDSWCVTWKLHNTDGTPLPHDQCPMAVALKEKRSVLGCEAVAERPDGQRRTFTPFPTPLFDEAGRLTGAVNMLVDITERKRAEETLRESEERFRAIVETTPECVKLVAADGTLLLMNEAGLAMVGATAADEVSGRSVYDLIAPEDRESFRTFNQRVCAGEKATLEFDIIGLKGKRCRMETHAVPLHRSDGSIIQLGITRDITERRKAEETRLLLGAIVDSSDDAIISKDLGGRITSWNQGAERLYGYTTAEAVGKSIMIVVPPDRQEEEREILARLQRGERVDHFETIRRRKDGAQVDVSLTISPLRNRLGEIIGVSKIARDITAQKRAEEAIRTLNAHLTEDLTAMTRMQQLSTRLIQSGGIPELLSEILDAGLEITAADMGNIQLLDDAGRLRIVAHRGFDAAFLEFFGDVHDGVAACGSALQKGERVIVEDVAGSPLFAATPARDAMLAAEARAVQSTPLVSRSGKVLGMFSTHNRRPKRPTERELRILDLLARQAADLIERKRGEEVRSQLSAIVEASGDAIYTYDLHGTIQTWNRAAEELYGFSPDEIIGRSSDTIVPPDRRDELHEIIAAAGNVADIVRNLETTRMRRDGSIFPALLTISPIRDESGKTVALSVIARDITKRKRAENELRRANQDLEQFAYSASHDLQEPLRTIKIYSELLADRLSSAVEGETAEYLDFLRNAATRMEILVRDLLAYTQVSRLEAPVEEVDTNAVFTEVIANLGGAIAESRAAVTCDTLPPVRVHKTHMRQLFQNLIGNAIKYRREDRPPAVFIGAERQDGHWVFRVRDNGIGIQPEFKEQIFGLFSRLHNADRYDGTGIGLAICQRVVERYHGRIWVESEPGRGSEFRFTLPV